MDLEFRYYFIESVDDYLSEIKCGCGYRNVLQNFLILDAGKFYEEMGKDYGENGGVYTVFSCPECNKDIFTLIINPKECERFFILWDGAEWIGEMSQEFEELGVNPDDLIDVEDTESIGIDMDKITNKEIIDGMREIFSRLSKKFFKRTLLPEEEKEFQELQKFRKFFK